MLLQKVLESTCNVARLTTMGRGAVWLDPAPGETHCLK